MEDLRTERQIQEEIDLIVTLCNCHGQMITPDYLLKTMCNGDTKLYLHIYSVFSELSRYDHIQGTLYGDSGKLSFRPNERTGLYLNNLRLTLRLKSVETRFVKVQTWLIIITAVATVWGGYMSYRQTTTQEKQYIIDLLQYNKGLATMPYQNPNSTLPCICSEDSLNK
jgi:hypothetical protein